MLADRHSDRVICTIPKSYRRRRGTGVIHVVNVAAEASSSSEATLDGACIREATGLRKHDARRQLCTRDESRVGNEIVHEKGIRATSVGILMR